MELVSLPLCHSRGGKKVFKLLILTMPNIEPGGTPTHQKSETLFDINFTYFINSSSNNIIIIALNSTQALFRGGN